MVRKTKRECGRQPWGLWQQQRMTPLSVCERDSWFPERLRERWGTLFSWLWIVRLWFFQQGEWQIGLRCVWAFPVSPSPGPGDWVNVFFYSEQPGVFLVGSGWVHDPRLTQLPRVCLSAPKCSDERCVRSSSIREVEHRASGVALGFVEAQTWFLSRLLSDDLVLGIRSTLSQDTWFITQRSV